MRNHTATHLLQQALRDVLGDHVHQAGSYVDNRRLRFDFSHFEAVKPGELAEIERIVNDRILDAVNVEHKIMPIEQAKKEGAIALFGEKYGDTVRIIDVSGYSIEFCGGTHVTNTSQIGLFKIISESSVAAGVRRIEATAGYGVLDMIDQKQNILDSVSEVFRTENESELAAKSQLAVSALKTAEKQVGQLRAKLSGLEVNDIMSNGVKVGEVTVYTAKIEGAADALRMAAEKIKDKDAYAVAVLAAVDGDKISLCAGCGEKAIVLGLKAGNIVKEIAALLGGSGGGRPDIAMAGGKDHDKLDKTLDKVADIVKEQV